MEPSMPKNNVSDPITDQEIAFARLVLSGTMTDRRAAEAVGLKPDSAAYTKSKPRVRAYMLEHRAAVQQQLLEQDTQGLRRFNVGRDKVLARLWDIANMDPERTRNSMSSQVKALSMIVAIEGLIPDRHSARSAVSAQDQPAPPPVNPPFYVSKWARNQKNGESADPEPPPPPAEEFGPEPEPVPGLANDQPPPVSDPNPGLTSKVTESIFPGLEHLANEAIDTSRPYVRFVPDAQVPFSIDKNRFGRRR
jgi:hypothetical protein